MDAKSLLRAQKAQARIEHPYASYTASGVLKCSICAVPVKQWEAHLLTKQHRTSLAREKAIQAKAAKSAKRAAPESSSGPASSKRARTDANATGEEDEEEEEGAGPVGLPAGFFSAGNGPSIPSRGDDDDDDDDDREGEGGPAVDGQAKSSAAAATAEPTGDPELDDFLASLEDDTPADLETTQPTAQSTTVQGAKKKGYKSSSTLDTPGIASYAAGPVMLNSAGTAGGEEGEGAGGAEEPEETEEEKRARIEREEREEIMGRLEDEERAQEDADSRVTALKARMDALKKRREARPAKSTKSAKA